MNPDFKKQLRKACMHIEKYRSSMCDNDLVIDNS